MIKLKNKETKANNVKKYTIVSILIILLLIVGLIFIDYFGIFKQHNIIINNFNFEFWDIFINALIVLTLYIITYVLIDKRTIKQEENKKNIANLLLTETYKNCLEDIEWMQKRDYRNHIAGKIDFSENMNSNVIYKKLIETPFDNQDMILSFSKEGIITAEQLKDYLETKKEFRKFITMSIVFYDKYEYVYEQKEVLKKCINNSKVKLFK